MSQIIHIQSPFATLCPDDDEGELEALFIGPPTIPGAGVALFFGKFLAGEYTAGLNCVVDSLACVPVTDEGKNDFGVGGRVLFIDGEKRVGLCSGERVWIGDGMGAADGRLGLRGGGEGVKSVFKRRGEGGGAGLGVEE